MVNVQRFQKKIFFLDFGEKIQKVSQIYVSDFESETNLLIILFRLTTFLFEKIWSLNKLQTQNIINFC